jgi:ABC-type lipoprotein export system ATPase subunit
MEPQIISKYFKGSEWRKWDLHVHSPASHGFSGSWDQFETQLKNSNCHVIGINDYFSVEGYKRIKGRIEKGELDIGDKKILPVVEFRMRDVLKNKHTTHSGTNINFHIVFSDVIPVEKIETFIKSLNVDGSQIADKYTDLQYLKDTAKVYFEQDVLDKLKANPDFQDNFVVWLPYDEYGGIDAIDPNSDDWIKRNFIKKSDVLGSSDRNQIGFFLWQSPLDKDGKCKFAIEQFREWFGYPKPCIKGSDSHSYDYSIGCLQDKNSQPSQKYCWIKADPSFEGLRQIIYEPEGRVFIGETPEIEVRVRSNQTKYIKSLHLSHVAGYDESHGTWFKDEEIEFSKELVAIIGNKGSGKSAITDIIGLLGNSHNQKYGKRDGTREELFSFLNKLKFLKPGYASNYEGVLSWYDGVPSKMTLDREVDENIPERVEYLPQKYLEKICANIDDDEFRGRLNEVIFGYVKEKFGTTDFEGLITYLTGQAKENIENAKLALHEKNEEIVSIEKKLTADYKKEIEEKIKVKENEATSHSKNIPPEKKAPQKSTETDTKKSTEIAGIETKINTLVAEIHQLKSENTAAAKQLEDIKQAKDAILRQETNLKDVKVKYKVFFEKLTLNVDDIIQTVFHYEKINQLITEKTSRINKIGVLLRTEDEINALELDDQGKTEAQSKSLCVQLARFELEKKGIIDQLGKPEQEYQEYLKQKLVWEAKQKAIVGENTNPVIGTLNWLKQELSNLADVYIKSRDSLRGERREIVKDIFNKKRALISFYDSVKESIDKEIGKYRKDLGNYNITIEAGLRFNSIFYDEFFKFINQSVKGSFCGLEAGRGVIKNLCEGKVAWQDEKDVISILDDIIGHLDNDQRKEVAVDDKIRDIFKQMKQQKNPVDFYDYLFGLEYLQTKYDLKVDDKDLSELSAGERGGLLLIFYLMLDMSDIPLVIDQPEDNLDNQSVYEILVTFLKKAKKRRQIIMVTHNPNLAVVADAEQIIHVSIDKKNKNDFDFCSGSIENPEINDRVVKILEGTMPAFDNRRLKYRKRDR